ncbi:MAG: hypothetical protein JWR67_2447 [Mucilaginibacter sp.]|nr:hypothetical protein [Mucilaginibacter sp.]
MIGRTKNAFSLGNNDNPFSTASFYVVLNVYMTLQPINIRALSSKLIIAI